MNRNSPMMEQYKRIKELHPDKLLMFQVGDFYELFYGDAETAAREMEIALTSRDAGSENPIPLAGVPIHSAESYLNRLLGKGYKVVICDQVESSAQAKGLVRREITRILTPGTITSPDMLDEGKNNYLAVITGTGNRGMGLAAVDISTGDFKITEQAGEDAAEIILDELRRLEPAEILCSSDKLAALVRNSLNSNMNTLVETLTILPEAEEIKNIINDRWDQNTWDNLDLSSYPLAASAASAALVYLEMLQQLPLTGSHFHNLELYFSSRNMVIDSITVKNLELTQSLREGGKEGSLLGLLDHCMTGMGRRLLKRWLEQPLLDPVLINERLDAVEELLNKPIQRVEIRKKLKAVFDLERFCSRLSYQRINARDLVALKNTLHLLEPIRESLEKTEASFLRRINRNMPSTKKLFQTIDQALVDDPPLTLREGGLFKKGYNEKLDHLKDISTNSSDTLIAYEQNERQRTGIKTLKVGYNRNFGYYIEITRANLKAVPEDYHRKQTLVNAERFTTEELNRMEEQITGARDKLAQLEYELFETLREEVSESIDELLLASELLAKLDCLQGLAETAEKYDYCRPVIRDKGSFKFKQGRHPVVERLAFERFVPNDLNMDDHHYLLLITGPNMAGKSTYIRSSALIAIMAQSGSFVPAKEATIPLLDRVFARVGASDDLSRGHSTFMVEMEETAIILKEATARSLIILDEIGRGTSTYDGMSIARGVIEYLARKIKAKTLFSTHYHELTRLEGELPGIKNYTMAVREKGKEVLFLRQVVPGKADKSYGINVARLAGVPPEVLFRAETILTELELAASSAAEQQLSLIPMVSLPNCDHCRELEIIDTIKELDINRLTPLEAMQKLFEIQGILMENCDSHSNDDQEEREEE